MSGSIESPANPWWNWSREHEFATDIGTAKQVLDELLGQLKSSGWNEKDVFAIHLAVEEALMNAIKHGNARDPGKTVTVRLRLSPERVWIEITDEGEGFDPEEVPDCTADENLELPSGRGLMLMRNFMCHVEFNERGNRVQMEKLAGS